MGKKQHQKDKLYLTCTEWSTLYGGKKRDDKSKGEFKRLPFHCCSLSMQPFEHPLCTLNGVIFDLMNIVPFLRKHGINPVTGEKMNAKELVKLTFYKNAEGKYHCPVTYKVFNANTHIVAVKPTGNVYCYDAVERLNIKPQHYKDLVSDAPFTRKDIITLQDPSNLDKFNFAMFYHVKNNIKLVSEEELKARKDPKYHLNAMSTETRDILAQLDRDYKAPEKKTETTKHADRINAATYSTGAVAASFTSTAMTPATEHEAAIINEDSLIYERITKKAYVRIVTNVGNLNVELHSDMVPKACENFLKLVQRGYYNNTTFHRSIRNFMIQGGDPTGTGKGGESIWGAPFQDHFKPNLTHSGRGVLSMANSGPNTNKSQFFITYRSCRHLDNKHTVFGRIVGGLETLDKMERIECDKHDKPLEDITIESCTVFVNPYEEAEEQLQKDRDDALEKERQEKLAEEQHRVTIKGSKPPTIFKKGVGKYINPTLKRDVVPEDPPTAPVKKKSKAVGFGDFSSW
ncbi:RING-type E3 ubiquitin-protein ligase PPIL2-like [Lineus longissimus]|uniref:RING-type E3 ubiquitin-protein ligase PPIL2-like n=1 Tax=Lineus longissimus TaxID=88925 RepID=UPI002B4D9232